MSLLSLAVLVLFIANIAINVIEPNWAAVIGWSVATLLQIERVYKEAGYE